MAAASSRKLMKIAASPRSRMRAWKTEAAAHQQARQRLPADAAIHGARTALPGLAKKDTPLGRWVKALLARAHRNIVTVALANKHARIAWAVLARDRQYCHRSSYRQMKGRE